MSLPAGAALAGAPSSVAGVPARPATGLTSLKAFGARGDGHADDTAALLAAVASRSEITIPNGRYRMSGRIAFDAPVRFDHGAVLEAARGAVIRFGGGVVAGPH